MHETLAIVKEWGASAWIGLHYKVPNVRLIPMTLIAAVINGCCTISYFY